MDEREPPGFERHNPCLELGRQRGIAEALNLSPEVAHITDGKIPTVFGKKWQAGFKKTRSKLEEDYGDGIIDLCRLALMLQRYGAVESASYFACLSDGKPIKGTVWEELITPEGYVNHEGYAFAFMDAVARNDKPEELLALTAFESWPDDADLFESMALVCFFEAANHWQEDEQKALDWLYEVSQLLMYSDGFAAWQTVEQELPRDRGSFGARKRHAKAAPLKEIARQAADENPDKSANALAIELEEQILNESRRVGYPLSPANVRNTIAGWIRRHRNKKVEEQET